MIRGIVREDPVDWVIWECITTVVQDGFDGGAGEEPHRLSHCHAREQIRETGAERVECKSFERVVVQGAVSVRDIETVMA